MAAENHISLRIGGPAGMGIMNTGLTFSKCCTRLGLHVFDYIEYPSLIRGGHNTYVIRAEPHAVHSQLKGTDILIALDKETLDQHAHELSERSIVFYDESVNPDETKLAQGIRCPLPFKKMVKAAGAKTIMGNTIALAAALGVMEYPFATFKTLLADTFAGKAKNVVTENVKLAKLGYEYAREHYKHHSDYRLQPVPDAPKKMVLTGNEAVALGAVAGGLKFYAAYPMTPSSTILHTLAAWQERHNIIVKHCEDEVSVVNMTIGAGYAGVRAMCATSGGGFGLMNEGLSLAGMTETPLVVVEVMRGGPGTGVPTWSGQEDLKWIVNAGHGEYPKIVLAPGDVEEAFYLAAEALNLAERYQTLVVIISDKYLGESHKSAEAFDTKKVRVDRGKLLKKVKPGFQRYAPSDDGVSPRTIPGVKDGFFLANSDEHDYHGWSTEEIPMRNLQVEKRIRKEATYAREMPQPTLVGAPEGEADVTIIAWGSTKGPIVDALQWLQKEGYKVNYLQIKVLRPFPAESVARIMKTARCTLLVESNHNGQLGDIIREQTGLVVNERMLRYDGRPFWPEDIYDNVKTIINERGGA